MDASLAVSKGTGLFRLAAAAVVATAAVVAGCNGDNSADTPSGTKSPAAIGGAGPGGGGGGASGLRVVGWNDAEVFPPDPTIPAAGWFFVNNPNIDVATLDILANGTSIAATSQLFAFPFSAGQTGPFDGFLIIADPIPAIGTAIQVTANDTAGNPLQSNTLTIKAGPFTSGNLPAPFTVLQPPDQSTNNGSTPTYSFTNAQGGVTYLIYNIQFDPAQGTIIEVPTVVEIQPAGGGTNTYTAASGTAQTVFTDQQLANPGAFNWHVAALDSSGWAVGTTIDVPGFVAAGAGQPPAQVLATWPVFTSN